MATTVPMLAPDGTSGEIPVNRASDAMAAGFKPAIAMVAPTGQTGYVPPDRQQDALNAGFKRQNEQQPGFWENLGHAFGIGTQEAEQRQQDLQQHPVRSTAEALLGPAYAAGKAIYQQGAQSVGELEQAGESLGRGNPAEAGVHAIQSVPIVGPAINKMAEQAPPTTPGQSYLSQVKSDATPGNVGTALGTAAQVAPMVLAGGTPAGLAKASSTIEGVLSDAADIPRVEPKPTVQGQNYTTAHAAAFEGAIAPATGMGPQFVPQEITPQALTPIRDTAARMAVGTPEEQAVVQTATSPKSAPLQRLTAYQGVVQSAMNDLESQFKPVMAKMAQTPVDTTPLVRQLAAKITPTTDVADASAIRNLMMRTSRADTVGELYNFKKTLDTETAAQYSQTQVKEGTTGISNQARNDLVGAVRGYFYDTLGKASGVDFQPLKLQESNLIKTQGALQKMESPLSIAEAKAQAPSSWKENIGTAADVIRAPKTTVTQHILGETPATKVANLLQKSLADLPEPTTLPAPPPTEPTSPIPAQPSRLMLPAQSGAPIITPYDQGMSIGEQRAAMLHYLRQRQQLALPAQAQPIRLPDGTMATNR